METQLSVVVVIGERRWRAERALRALLAQREAPRMQIIVVDVHPDGGPPQSCAEPRTHYFPRPESASMADAKAFGARQATGEIIAFIEDHCVASPEWAAAVWRAFQQTSNAGVVAYAFRNLNPVNYVSRSFHVLAYGPWMAPVDSGYIQTPSWMNVAYRAGTLRPYMDKLQMHLECETLLHAELRRAGCRFWQAGDAEVSHLNHPGLLGSCRDSAVWQRLFAAARMKREGWHWTRRMVYVAGSPLSPLVIAYRLGRRLWQRPALRLEFITSLPLVLAVYSYGMVNEVRGYLFGAGDSSRQSLEVETADPRGEPA